MKRCTLIIVFLLLQGGRCDIIMQDLAFPCGQSSSNQSLSYMMGPNGHQSATDGEISTTTAIRYIAIGLCTLAGMAVIVRFCGPTKKKNPARHPQAEAASVPHPASASAPLTSSAPAQAPLPRPPPPQLPRAKIYTNTFSGQYEDTSQAVQRLILDERYRSFSRGQLAIPDERYSRIHEEGQKEIIEKQGEIMGEEEENPRKIE